MRGIARDGFRFLVLMVGVAAFLAYGYWLGGKATHEPPGYDSNQMIEQALVQRVPTIRQMQRAVGAEPDGFWGKDSQAKWESILCQQGADDSWPKGE